MADEYDYVSLWRSQQNGIQNSAVHTAFGKPIGFPTIKCFAYLR